ncbi:MAG: UDP-N-acetylmuramoyl-L-alanine--D-glutamate ligase [Candidatus Gottesmanbacteria bacterium]|nr:UDP-N-acetylmuramoyl-L-alanine--D-glutamate ligase [Candidatus Gottesmanbacteria bacterium]
MNEIPNTHVLVLGYGREGQSIHRYLQAHHPELTIGIADQKEINTVVDGNVHVHTGKEYLSSIKGYNVIIRSPGIPTSLPELQKAREQGKWVTSATNVFFSECPGMIIGITGTKGKSTTTSMIADIVKMQHPDVRLVGNIGKPALDYLNSASSSTIFVMELSSHQLEDSRYSPHIAVVLNIVPEHLDYYDDLDHYVRAKGQIVNHQTSQDIVIFNPTHQILTRLLEQAKSQKYLFSLTPGPNLFCWLEKGAIYTKKTTGQPQLVLSQEKITTLGMGNVENTLAAVSVGLVLNIPADKIQQAVAEFKPLPHRLEKVGEVRGITFYNDSLATIPEATMHALEALGPNVVTLIAGGYDRGLDYTKLGQFIADKSTVHTLILFPDTGPKIWEAVRRSQGEKNDQLSHFPVQTIEEAVDLAFKHTPAGKICLLSPAAASFNLFKDYQDRGDSFKRVVLSRR